MGSRRSGTTLIELLVVIGIIVILFGILIVAVQYVRESARRTTCQHNLRQNLLAIQNHETANASLPSLYNGTFLMQPRYALDEFHFHSWRTTILPNLEHNDLFERIDFSIPATDAVNQPIRNSPVAVFVCPSTSNPSSLVPDIFAINDGQLPTGTTGTAARSDYEVIGGIFVQSSGTTDLKNIRYGAWGEPQPYRAAGNSAPYRKPRLKDISDGLSNTMLVAERAGRPDLYRKGQQVDSYPYSNPNEGMDHHQAAWGISTHFWWLVFWHEQSINASNAQGIYSFHSTGANVGFADGSVRFLSELMNQNTLNAMATRSEGDVVSQE